MASSQCSGAASNCIRSGIRGIGMRLGLGKGDFLGGFGRFWGLGLGREVLGLLRDLWRGSIGIGIRSSGSSRPRPVIMC